ncbi:MAG: hypothetical protein CFE46_04575 [Burkholderiales bacterium PBB6]|nr:MAG: hypothetical protein CFE46_04575 [Burkholderiales bacterium PBB6]
MVAPLELLPHLPAISNYAHLAEALTMAGEFALVVLLACLAATPLSAATGLVLGVLRRRGASSGLADGLRLHAALLLGISLVHGTKVWLVQSGLPGHHLAQGNGAVWAGAALMLTALVFMRTRRGGAAVVPPWMRLSAVLMAVLILQAWLQPWIHGPAKAVAPALNNTADNRPDVILVTIDTFSAKHASLYGYGRATTPKLDALATTATVFDRFYANGNFTTAGVASFTGGVRPWTHRAFLAPSHVAAGLPQQSLVARFHDAGYRTLAVSSNPWAAPTNLDMNPWLDAQAESQPWKRLCPWDPDNLLPQLAGPKTRALLATQGWYAAPRNALLQALLKHGVCPPSGHFDPTDAFQHALQLLDTRASDDKRPTLLWVHLTPPHDPYAPPPPFVGTFDSSSQARTLLDSSPAYHYNTSALPNDLRARLEARYDEALLYTDAAFGDFVETLRQRGQLDRAALVVSADHGESFRNDYGAHGGPELFDEVLHIPLVIKLPGQIQGRRVAQVTEQADLLPTLTSIAGLTMPPGLEGRSLMPLLESRALPEVPAFAMSFERQRPDAALERGTVVIIDGHWKLHQIVGTPDPLTPQPKSTRLFNLATDPLERTDVSGLHPDIVQRLRGVIDAKVQAHRLPPSHTP